MVSQVCKSLLQAVTDVAKNIDSFTNTYIKQTICAHGYLLALTAMKSASLDVYRIFIQRERDICQTLLKVTLAAAEAPLFF